MVRSGEDGRSSCAGSDACFKVKVSSAQIHCSRTETVVGEQIECGFRATAESGDALKELPRK